MIRQALNNIDEKYLLDQNGEELPRMIFKGGSNAPMIGDLRPANNGAQYEYKGNVFEVQSKEINGHENNTVTFYLSKDHSKYTITGWIYKDDGYKYMKFNLGYYKAFFALSKSRHKKDVPAEWKKYEPLIKEIHQKIFRGKSK